MADREHKQTGPQTRTGKAASSRNSTKHGLRGNPEKLLPGETLADYEAVRDSWLAVYDSSKPGVETLVLQLINNDRLLRLAATLVFEAQAKLAEAPLDGAAHKQLDLLLRYKTTHERAFARSLRNLEQFEHRRVQEDIALRRIAVQEIVATHKIALSCAKHGIPTPKQAINDGYQPLAMNREEAIEPNGTGPPRTLK